MGTPLLFATMQCAISWRSTPPKRPSATKAPRTYPFIDGRRYVVSIGTPKVVESTETVRGIWEPIIHAKIGMMRRNVQWIRMGMP